MAIISVPIRVNEDLRPSRLVKSISSYIRISILTMMRIFVVYRPFYSFMLVGSTIFSIGFILGARFLIHYFFYSGEGMIQSLVLSSVLLVSGFMTIMLGFISDLLSVNRKLLEQLSVQHLKDQS